MPVILLYLVKLSVSMLTVYLFYKFVLRRLTFYNWNRFYLFAYTALSFLIPFINITPVLQRNEMMNNKVVRFIPQVGDMHETVVDKIPNAVHDSTSWSFSDWVLYIAIAGAVIMLIRLLVQLVSFKRIISKAQLVSDNGVKLYQVNRSIIPFSFGNAIFINQQLHSDDELKEIIRHEFVHVRQKHTMDIIWSELLCILNWYNPFAWLIRSAIRQNLEFIADNKVLQTGFDKKQYQYLLLKVIGNNHFSIASQFNFSSLKKRIAMMNKMKSARVHLVKFLFLLPLLTVLILSFRSGNGKKLNSDEFYTVTGIVYNWDTEQPLADVNISDNSNVINVQTDKNGFYSIQLDAKENQGRYFLVSLSKPGYKKSQSGFTVGNNSEQYDIRFIGIVDSDSKSSGIDLADLSRTDKNGNIITTPDYEFLKEKFNETLEHERLTKKVDKLVGNSEKPIWLIDNIPFAIGAGAKAWFSKEEVEQSPEFRVLVDGKVMTMDEVNRIVKRSMVRSVGASPKAFAKEQYNVNYNLLILGLYKNENKKNLDLPSQQKISDTIPSNVLFILDGKELPKGTILENAISNDDIESIEVLKDKKAKELYGEKAKEGVLIVTSKKNIGSQSIFNAVKDTIPATKFKKLTIDDKNIATVILTNGKTEVYNLNNETEKMNFNAKFPINANDEIVEVRGLTGAKSVVSGTTVQTTANETVSLSGTFTAKPVSATDVTISTTSTKVYPVKATVSGVTVNSTFSGEPVKEVFSAEPVKEIKNVEGSIIMEVKNSMSEVQVKKIAADIKSKGYDFVISKIEYDNGKIVLFKGVLSSKDKKQYIHAADFSNFIISVSKDQHDKSIFHFYIGSGKLVATDTPDWQ